MNELPPPKEQAQVGTFAAYTGQLMQQSSRVHFNVGQEIVVTTEDKVWRILTNNLSRIERRNAWITPLGILVTLLVVFPTTSFQQFLFSAETWEAIFVTATGLSFLWFVRCIWQSKGPAPFVDFAKSLWQGRGPTVDDVVNDIKKTAIATEISQSKGTQVLFYDQFDAFTGWRKYDKGSVSQSAEFYHAGGHSLKKHDNNDPNGGFKEIGRSIGLGVAFLGWMYRPIKQGGGQANRLAIEDSHFNGYGFAVDNDKNTVYIERRDGGRRTRIGSESALNSPLLNQWYRFEFRMRTGGEFGLRLYSHSGEKLVEIALILDSKYSQFDRIAVHGGFPYYVDELRIQAL